MRSGQGCAWASIVAAGLVAMGFVAGCHREPRDESKRVLAPSVASKVAPPPPTPKVEHAPLAREGVTRESSGIAVARLGAARVALIADADDRALTEVSLDTRAVTGTTQLTSRPRDLMLLEDGTVAASLPEESAVVVLARVAGSAARYEEVRRLATPAEPLAMALDPSGSMLFVTTGASHSLLAFSMGAAPAEQGRVVIAREPRAVLVSADGARVFVSHASTGVLTVVNTSALGAAAPPASAVQVIDLGLMPQCVTDGGCARARLSRHENALVRAMRGDAEQVIAATVQVQPNPTTETFHRGMAAPSLTSDSPPPMVSGYGIGSGADGPPAFMELRQVDAKTLERAGSGMLDIEGVRCLLPRAAVATKTRVLVACEGGSTVEAFAIPNGMPGIDAHSERIHVARGPHALALSADDAKLYAWSEIARTFAEIDLSSVHAADRDAATKAAKKRTLFEIGVPRAIARDATWLRGRDLFYTTFDARISADGRGCASCHIDGRDDAVTWATPKGMRRTRTLAGQLGRGPYGWNGEHATLAEHVRATFKELGGEGLVGEDLDALLAYVPTIDAPIAASAALGEQAQRGRAIFESAHFDCAGCHADDGRVTDRMPHDVGTGGAFVTPTLAGVATRKSLMHDGRYASLEALLAGSRAMGNAPDLDLGERTAVIAYLGTL